MESAKMAVLLVDDDADLLEQVRVVVAREFDVELANSGAEAIEKLARKHYDCIVMDVMMQSLGDELDAAKKIKENAATRTIPVIMVTGVFEHYDYREEIDAGFFPNDCWLNKPVDPHVLMEEIRKLVARGAANA